MFLRLLEGAFEAMPQTIVQGIVLYEDLTSSHVRFIQWQSFIVSFVALGTSFASVAMHRQRDKWKEETKHNKKKKKVETSWEVIKGFCLMLFLGVDSFLRMNSIASVLYSPYAIWFPLYIAVAYAGLPLLVVTGTMIFVNCCDKEQQGQDHVLWHPADVKPGFPHTSRFGDVLELSPVFYSATLRTPCHGCLEFLGRRTLDLGTFGIVVCICCCNDPRSDDARTALW